MQTNTDMPRAESRRVKAGGIDEDRLRDYVERIKTESDTADEAKEALRELYVEAKAAGFDPKALRAAIKIMRQTAEDAERASTHAERVEQYLRALGHNG